MDAFAQRLLASRLDRGQAVAQYRGEDVGRWRGLVLLRVLSLCCVQSADTDGPRTKCELTHPTARHPWLEQRHRAISWRFAHFAAESFMERSAQ
jgi:hypothetical protein